MPLSLSAAEPELEYAITDSDAQRVITNTELSTKLAPLCQRLGIPLTVVDEISGGDPQPLPMIQPDRRAMILYTSGTTNKPKGVVSTHANVEAQVEAHTLMMSTMPWLVQMIHPMH